MPETPAASTAKVLTLEPHDAERLARLCGPCDENLRQIEARLGVRMHNRGHQFVVDDARDRPVDGHSSARINQASALLQRLYQETADGRELTAEVIHLHLQSANVQSLEHAQHSEEPAGKLTITTRRRSIEPRGPNQQVYVRAIREHDVNFGVGPAGTGKTYLAVACAVEAFEKDQVARILLVRPAVEAGEKLGFLPGDLSQKIDPYLRPLFDALYEMIGGDRVNKLIERNVIEVAPLAYMRGRTLSNSFIILDESQNTTVEQMKMFLTRIGYGSTAVITGDVTQIDLPRGTRSGLLHGLDVLEGVPGISFTRFASKDVVRHPLVQAIVDAYERFEGQPRHSS